MSRPGSDPVAVIGLAARVPGAEDLADLADLDSRPPTPARTVPPGRWSPAQYLGADGALGRHRFGRFLVDPFSFDHTLFELPREQALRLDPQHRLMLETGYQALEAAGVLGTPGRRDVGVFVGSRMNSYGYDAASQAPAGHRDLAAATLWGRSQNFAAAWLSDRLDLSGPSLVVDTACSSSLTAVWAACRSLQGGDCRVALAGGVDLLIDPLTYVLLSQAGALADDGTCKTFDVAADGYGPGEGAAALVLKRLSDARRDGDDILGVVEGVWANNDGSTMGVTTPSVTAQIELLERAYAHVDARRLRYLETHGTGTAIGDPIETQALATVLARHGVERRAVALGAVKRRLGHLHSAAGVVGLAHALLVLASRRLPTLPVTELNPRLRLERTPLFVPLSGGAPPPDPDPDGPLRDAAGVSAFGFGGTNVHVVVSTHDATTPESAGSGHDRVAGRDPVELLVLSAPTDHQLRELAAQWVERLAAVGPGEIADLCATARLRRPHHRRRLAVAAPPERLRAELLGRLLTHTGQQGDDPVPFPLGTAAVTAWLEDLSGAVPEVGARVAALEAAVGVPLTAFPDELRDLAAGLCATVALAVRGVPETAITAGAGLAALAGHAWHGHDLTDVLRAVLAADVDAPLGDPSGGPGVLPALAAADATGQALPVLVGIVGQVYERGFAVDFDRFQGDRGWRSRPLPALRLAGPPLTLAEPRRSPPPGTPTRLLDSTPDGGWSFARVYSSAEPVICQHEVYGTPMMPGVGWIEFLAQGARVAGRPFHGLSDVVFARPLIPTELVTVTCRVDAQGRFEIGDDDASYVTGAYLDTAASWPPHDPAGLVADADRLVCGGELYRWLRRLGYAHGRLFRNVSWLASVPGGTVARVEGHRQREIDAEAAALSTPLLDSVTIAGIDPASDVFGRDDAPVFVPISIARLHVHGDLGDAAYVRTREHHRGTQTCRLTQEVLDSDGRPLIVLEGIASKRVPPGAFRLGVRPAAEQPAEQPSPALPHAAELPAAEPPAEEPVLVTREVPTVERAVGHSPAVLPWLLAQLGIDEADADQEFLDLGLDSVALVEFGARIEPQLQVQLYPTVMFEYPTAVAFARYLQSIGAVVPGAAVDPMAAGPETMDDVVVGETSAMDAAVADVAVADAVVADVAVADAVVADVVAVADESAARSGRPVGSGARDIAVIGLSVRTPGAADVAGFWQVMREGKCTVVDPPAPRRARRPDLDGPASYLERVDGFDPAPFRIAPREAPMLDPQARLAYEGIWEALEDAGWTWSRRVGLWVGYSHDHYYEEKVRHGVTTGRGLGLEAMIANRLSFLMDWTGPSSVVNTLCSSGLVALHQAVTSLRAGECDVAVVSAVHAGIGPEYLASMREMDALSAQGLCRAFDAEADGFVPGEGVVSVVLAPLDRARIRNRRIQAVIRGTAVNHNGRTTRYSAPSPAGQREVIRACLAEAGVRPERIGLLEAHGTGTRLGDPVEVEGIATAWRELTARTQFCAIGSVKSAIGHLEPAAGLAGLAKAILAMQHGVVPRTLHVRRPNDHIAFETTPFYIADRERHWPREDGPRIAAVSAFGMGGVNAHVIVEEAAASSAPLSAAPGALVLRVTGATETAVRNLAVRYAGWLEQAPADQVRDGCATVTTGRLGQRFRAVVTGRDVHELLDGLGSLAAGAAPIRRTPNGGGRVCFLFGGQGSQYTGMGLGLLAAEPAIAAVVDEMDAVLGGHGAPALAELWAMDDATLSHTEHAQVAVVGLQVAMSSLLRGWGVLPAAVLGHSVGELTAAWAAGVLSLPDLIELTLQRARLMQAVPGGAGAGTMAVVYGPEAAVTAECADAAGVVVAAVNGAHLVTVAGSVAAVEAYCATSRFRTRRLQVSHAFHSPAMTSAVAPFRAAVAQVVARGGLAAPSLPFASSVTGRWHDAASVADPDTWARAITDPVLFAPAVGLLVREGFSAYVEVGAQPVLLPVAKADHPGAHWIPTLQRRPRTDHPPRVVQQHQLYNALAELAQHVDPAWDRLYPGSRVVPAPTYPFERRPYWVGEEQSE